VCIRFIKFYFTLLGLKEGGKSAGNVIRYLGNNIPIALGAPDQPTYQSVGPYYQMSEEEIAAEEKKAEYVRQQAELLHSYTKTATSAIMLPIRMIGRKAVELAHSGTEEEQGWKKAVMDTVGGCGNGIMSIAKGFTEVFNFIDSLTFAGPTRSWTSYRRSHYGKSG
jgi:hypothetical protein